MTARPWMPLYVADYLADTLDLGAEDSGIYLLLLMLAWRRNGSIPNDMPQLKRSLNAMVVGMHGNRFNRLVPPILERFFKLDSKGNWVNKRLTSELKKARKLSRSQKQNAKKRWSRSNTNKDLADAVAMPAGASLQSHSQSHSPSQEEKKKDIPPDGGSPVDGFALTSEEPAAGKLNGKHHAYPEEFEAVWHEYQPIAPKNATKADAYAAWRKLDGDDRKLCWTGVVNYAVWLIDERKRKPDTPVKHLATFINKRGWEPFMEQGQ